MDTDARTKACTSVKFARVCVELNVRQQVPDSVWIHLPNDQGFWQPIVVETKLLYCSKCRVHGHNFAICRKAKVPDATHNQQGAAVSGEVLKPGDMSNPISINEIPSKDNVASEWVRVGYKKSRKGKLVDGVPPGSSIVVPQAAHNPDNNLALVISERDPSSGFLDGQHSKDVSETSLAPAAPPSSSAYNLNPGIVQPSQIEGHREADSTESDFSAAPNDFSGAELRLKKLSSNQIFFSEELNALVHPDSLQHYKNIQDKAGSSSRLTSSQSERVLSDALKECLIPGSKHCPPNPSQ